MLPHQWRRGSVLKADRREVPGSISDRGCLPIRLEFSVVFSKTCVNMARIPYINTHGGHFPYRPRSHNRTIDLNLKAYNKCVSKNLKKRNYDIYFNLKTVILNE